VVLPKNLYFKWLFHDGHSEDARQWNLPTKNEPGKKMPRPESGKKYSFCNPTWFITWMRNRLFVAEVLDAEVDSSVPELEWAERDYLGTDTRLLFEIETFSRSLAFKFACDCFEHALSSDDINSSLESYLKTSILQVQKCTENLDSIEMEAKRYLKNNIDENTRECRLLQALLEIIKGVRCSKDSSEWYSFFNKSVMLASDAVSNTKEEWTWQTDQFLAYIRPELDDRLKLYDVVSE
jgi:hypothetical protein